MNPHSDAERQAGILILSQLKMFNEAVVYFEQHLGNDSNLLIVFYVQIMPDDFVMQLHRF
ncbi:Uncharacterised protein [Klebsiella pneumoniae]|nr:Uncharacterised protein [Klebsiella pneumoniae]